MKDTNSLPGRYRIEQAFDGSWVVEKSWGIFWVPIITRTPLDKAIERLREYDPTAFE